MYDVQAGVELYLEPTSVRFAPGSGHSLKIAQNGRPIAIPLDMNVDRIFGLLREIESAA